MADNLETRVSELERRMNIAQCKVCEKPPMRMIVSECNHKDCPFDRVTAIRRLHKVSP